MAHGCDTHPSDVQSRFDTVCHIFSCCTHQEQLYLLNILPEYLKRDFIGLLPQELAVKIVSYLEPEHVLKNCLLVNKQWYLLLKTFESYWKTQCEKHGIIGEVLEHEKAKVKSFSNLTISALKFEHRLSNEGLKVKNLSIHEAFGDCVFPIFPFSNGYFYRLQPSSESSLSILKFDLPNSSNGQVCATVSDPFPGGLLKVLWSFSSLNSVLLYGNNGRWIKFTLDGQQCAVVEEWQDVIYDVVSYRSTVCSDCWQIIVMSTVLNFDFLWELQMIQLHAGKTRPTKNLVTFNYMPEQHYKQEPFFTVNKIESIPQSCKKDGTTTHFLLIQFGGAVVSFLLTTEGDECFISEPLNVYAPNITSCIKLVPTTFTLSLNRSLLGIISYEPLKLCIYDLKNFSESKCIIGYLCHQEVANVQCLAVGKLFSILTVFSTSNSYYSIFVVSTRTGNIIQQFSMLSILPYYYNHYMLFKFYGPTNQQWLNTLEMSMNCELEFCVCICVDKSNSRTPQCTLMLWM